MKNSLGRWQKTEAQPRFCSAAARVRRADAPFSSGQTSLRIEQDWSVTDDTPLRTEESRRSWRATRFWR